MSSIFLPSRKLICLCFAVLVFAFPVPVTFAQTESGTIQFAASASSHSETAGHAIVTVVRTSGAIGSVSVSYATSSETAATGADYVSAAGAITFADGVTQQTIAVPIQNDGALESDETFVVTLSDPTGGAVLGVPSAHVVTIQSEDPPPLAPTLSFASRETVATEASGVVVVKVVRAGNPETSVSVAFQTLTSEGQLSFGEIAEDHVDYVPTSGRLTFAPFVMEQTISIPLVDDSAPEWLPETVTVKLSDPTNSAVIGENSSHAVRIVSDDGVTSVSFSSSRGVVTEAGETFRTKVVRLGDPSVAFTVRIGCDPGTAKSEDFTAVSGSITFAPGEIEKEVSIPIASDLIVEPSESFTIGIGFDPLAPVVNLGLSQIEVTILDDESAGFAFETDESSEFEGEFYHSIRVQRIGDISKPGGVTLIASSRSAVAGVDFEFTPITLSFAAGELNKTAAVLLWGDSIDEFDESFVLTLTSATGAAIGAHNTHTVTVRDQSPPPFTRGSYRGLIEYPSDDFGGTIVLTVAASGRVSGVLNWEGSALPFRGRFTPGGQFTYEFPARLAPDSEEMSLTLQLSTDGTSLSGTFKAGAIDFWTIAAKRNRSLDPSTITSEKGAYTGALHDYFDRASCVGHLSTKVEASGRIRGTARLPNGVPVSFGSHFAEGGTFTIYKHTRQGHSLGGSAEIDLGDALQLSGDLRYIIVSETTSSDIVVTYSGDAKLTGARYAAPRITRILDDFNAAQGAAHLQFGIDQGYLKIPFTWTSGNAAVFSQQGLPEARLRFQPSTGLWSGYVVDQSGIRRTLRGICIQQPDPGADFATGIYNDGEWWSAVNIVPGN